MLLRSGVVFTRSVPLFGTLAVTGPAWAAGPQPAGEATVTVRYDTADGPAVFSAPRDFNGVGPLDATVLADAPNIKAVNAINTFGRRTQLAANPKHAHVLGADESLLTHAFFKIDNATKYFPGLTENGRITLTFSDIHFDRRVMIHTDTLLLHVRWNDQNKQLPRPYIHLDDHHTLDADFRDLGDFLASGFFGERPVPTYLLASPETLWAVQGDGTDTLSITVSFRYDALRNFEETGQEVPEHLPAPQGFLEPFHFHVEYVVTNDPRPPVRTVEIDFDPTRCPNEFDKRGRSVDLIVIGDPQFDVWRINVASMALSRADGAGSAVTPKERRRRGRLIRFKDVATPSAGGPCVCPDQTPDGKLDRVVTLATSDVIEALGLNDVPADTVLPIKLTGRLIDGTPFEGQDCLVVPGRGRERR